MNWSCLNKDYHNGLSFIFFGSVSFYAQWIDYCQSTTFFEELDNVLRMKSNQTVLHTQLYKLTKPLNIPLLSHQKSIKLFVQQEEHSNTERALTSAHFFLQGLILLSQNSPFQSPSQSRHQSLHQETITLRFYPLTLTTKTRAERRSHHLC